MSRPEQSVAAQSEPTNLANASRDDTCRSDIDPARAAAKSAPASPGETHVATIELGPWVNVALNAVWSESRPE